MPDPRANPFPPSHCESCFPERAEFSTYSNLFINFLVAFVKANSGFIFKTLLRSPVRTKYHRILPLYCRFIPQPPTASAAPGFLLPLFPWRRRLRKIKPTSAAFFCTFLARVRAGRASGTLFEDICLGLHMFFFFFNASQFTSTCSAVSTEMFPEHMRMAINHFLTDALNDIIQCKAAFLGFDGRMEYNLHKHIPVLPSSCPYRLYQWHPPLHRLPPAYPPAGFHGSAPYPKGIHSHCEAAR